MDWISRVLFFCKKWKNASFFARLTISRKTPKMEHVSEENDSGKQSSLLPMSRVSGHQLFIIAN